MQAISMIRPADMPGQLSVGTSMASEPPSLMSANGMLENLPSPYGKDMDVYPGMLSHPPLTVVPVHRRRRSSKSALATMIKRSASTPNVRGQAATDAAAALAFAADKRRNKLGYHRTSVACGHCRRRKIRCLLAPDDHQGRCSNCIRLKKECNFFPVDQQPQPDRASRSGSKLDRSDENSSSSSPSPGLPQEVVSDSESFNQYNGAPLPASQEFAVPSEGPRSGSVSSTLSKASRLSSKPRSQRPSLAHMQTAPLMSRSYEVERRSSPWDNSPYDESPLTAEPKSAMEDPSSNFWRLAESPMTSATFSYGGPSPVTPMYHRESMSAFPTVGPREDLGWPIPGRTMSVTSQYAEYPRDYNNYPPMHNEIKHPQSASIYPPSLNTSNISVASMNEPQSAPADGQPLPGPYGSQPGWNPSFIANTMTGMTGKGAEGFGGWYSEPGHLAQVDEEDTVGHLGEEGPLIYQPVATAV